jgi:hypothetical protein
MYYILCSDKVKVWFHASPFWVVKVHLRRLFTSDRVVNHRIEFKKGQKRCGFCEMHGLLRSLSWPRRGVECTQDMHIGHRVGARRKGVKRAREQERPLRELRTLPLALPCFLPCDHAPAALARRPSFPRIPLRFGREEKTASCMLTEGAPRSGPGRWNHKIKSKKEKGSWDHELNSSGNDGSPVLPATARFHASTQNNQTKRIRG